MNENRFDYKYVAPTEEERKEIASIRRQYAPEEKSESKLDRLRRLDFHVKNTATVFSLCFGVIGLLVFGLGLSMILEWKLFFWGIVVAVVGGGVLALAYPVYASVLKKNKKKYSAEILKLSEELLRGDDE